MTKPSYRSSHIGADRGQIYDKHYIQQYESFVWENIEKPLISSILSELERTEHLSDCMDFACGTGRILSVLDKYSNNIVGIDISKDMLANAKDKYPEITFINADLTKQNLDIGPFDLITSFRFFLNAEDILRKDVLSTFNSYIKAGGYLLINTHMTPWSIHGIRLKLRKAITKKENVESTLSSNDLKRLVEGYGYKCVNTKSYRLLPTLKGKLVLPGFIFKAIDTIASKLPFSNIYCHNTMFLFKKL